MNQADDPDNVSNRSQELYEGYQFRMSSGSLSYPRTF